MKYRQHYAIMLCARTKNNDLHVRMKKFPKSGYSKLTCTCRYLIKMFLHILNQPAHAHTKFNLQVHIPKIMHVSLHSAYTKMTWTCAYQYHIRLRIPKSSAPAHTKLSCTCAYQNHLRLHILNCLAPAHTKISCACT